MGIYVNIGNDAFARIRKGPYVDKTGLIGCMNEVIGTARPQICFTRPRRFGKTYSARMMAAYYDKSCDSEELFQGLKIAEADSFREHLNKYTVIYIDMIWFLSTLEDKGTVVRSLQDAVIAELNEIYPDAVRPDETILPQAMIHINQKYEEKFFVVIDECDAVFREMKDDSKQQFEFVNLLRAMFKSGPTMQRAIAGAYLTGILPLKKYGTESALTDFYEYSMTEPAGLAEYVGFTEKEVRELCESRGMDFEDMQKWYDGYSFDYIQHMYSPNSVMIALRERQIRNYWPQTESFENLKKYIGMNFDGLKDAIIRMLGGESVRTRVSTFQNDITSFRNKNDVLTLLIHFGYLAYDAKTRKVWIPNLEVMEAFEDAVSGDEWGAVGAAIADSEDLLDATINQDSDAVADTLERIHGSVSSVLQYNNEASLSCAITIAYYTAKRYYYIVRELPTGKGFADLAFLPGRNVDKPALLVELKYDKDADTAIRQIHENRYQGELAKYFGNLLLVGVNYDREATGKDAKRHSCVIENA